MQAPNGEHVHGDSQKRKAAEIEAAPSAEQQTNKKKNKKGGPSNTRGHALNMAAKDNDAQAAVT